MARLSLAVVVCAGLASSALAAPTSFSENFDSGLGSFTNVDVIAAFLSPPSNVRGWDTNNNIITASGGTRANWIDGASNGPTDRVAMVDSDAVGSAGAGAYDIALVSQAFDVTSVSTLSFSHIYRDASFASETAKVEITVNGGTSWIALATYTASQFTGSPAYSAAADNGKFVSFDLSAYAGQTAQVRFRYTDTSSGAWNWYWQIDDVTVTPTPAAAALLGLGGLAAARRRRA